VADATAIMLNVDQVQLAARDEFFEELDDLWRHHAYP